MNSQLPSFFNSSFGRAFDMLTQLEKELTEKFDSFSPMSGFEILALPGREFPKTNLYFDKEKNQTIVELAVPGFKEADLKVNISKGLLTVSGEKVGKPENTSTKTYKTREIAARSFTRSWQLPKNTIIEQIGASLEDGMLTLTIPIAKEEAPATYKIQITTPNVLENKTETA